MTCLFGLDNMMINILFDVFFCLKILYVHETYSMRKYTYFLDICYFFLKKRGNAFTDLWVIKCFHALKKDGINACFKTDYEIKLLFCKNIIFSKLFVNYKS